MEDKVEELAQSGKDNQKLLRKYELTIPDLWDTTKRPNL
jgi:hypothetical protein